MAREIVIDTDTVVGYNFLISKFYVENKGSLTYRDTATLIKQVLDIVAPSNTITLAQIQELKDIYETLTALYFTWYDNGSFIKTLQLNTYDKFPLVLDAFKKKLYIMNTNLIFDLSLNEGKQYRVDYLIAYYKDNIGLALTNTEMGKLYDLLIQYYENPTCYNEIDLTVLDDTDTTKLYYNNIYALSNYNESAKVVYSCTENPNNVYQYQEVAKAIGLDQTNKQIILNGTPNTTLTVGQEINLYNLNNVIDGVTYSADGTYTLTNQSNNILTVAEPLPFNYSFPYKVAKLQNSKTTITSVARDTLTITLSANVPDTIKVGDIIHIVGTQQAVDNETVSADGEYTVATISSNKLTVQEQPNCNYTGTTAYICKRIEQGNITSISNNTLYLDKSISLTGTPIIEVWADDQLEYSFTMASATTNTITSSTTITDYNPTLPQVRVNTPNSEILIDITTSKNTSYPTGEFIVDNFSQCKAYIQSYPNATTPTDTNHANVGQQLATTYPSVSGLPTITLKGIYSKVYTGN